MRKRFRTRLYTNVILSAIASLLLLMTLHMYRVSVESTARAEGVTFSAPQRPGGSSAVGTPSPVSPYGGMSIPQTQDLAVAAATADVAGANREIASAIRDLAKAADRIADAIKSAQPGGGGGAASAPSDEGGASSAPSSGIDVQVGGRK